MEDFRSPLPLAARLEPCVPAHEFREKRVELVLGAELEFERVHEGDEVLSTEIGSARGAMER